MRRGGDRLPLGPGRAITGWRGSLVIAVALLLAWWPSLPAAGADSAVSAHVVFSRMTSAGRVVVVKDDVDTPLEKEIVLKLRGVIIPVHAIPHAIRYTTSMSTGVPLTVRLYSTSGREYLSEVLVHRDARKYNLNKTLLTCGFAYLDKGDAACKDWASYEASARRERRGIWSEGRARWPSYAAPRSAAPRSAAHRSAAPANGKRPLPAIGGDRAAIIARYGYPDQTLNNYGHAMYVNGVYVPRSLLVFDQYHRLGVIFIYRNGKLIEKQDRY